MTKFKEEYAIVIFPDNGGEPLLKVMGEHEAAKKEAADFMNTDGVKEVGLYRRIATCKTETKVVWETP